MKKILIAFFTLISLHSIAQSPVVDRLQSGVDLGLAFTNKNYNPTFSYYQLLHLGEKKLFSIGWNGRFGAFYGNDLAYYTAPARLTRGKSGFNALGAPLIPDNIDTVTYGFVSMTSLNFGVRAQINLGPVAIGGSADLFGLTIGKSRIGHYISSKGRFMNSDSIPKPAPFKGDSVFQKTKPTNFNLRMLGDNDMGTLATEVYARVLISKRIGVKVAYQWLTTEVTAQNRDIIADNNRFRNRQGMPYVAVTFPVFQ